MTYIEVCDVSPRDGLQSEPIALSPAIRAELVTRLAAAGLPRVEVASFVNPKAVPSMAGAEEVVALLQDRPGVTYAGLVLNEKGYERLVSSGLREVHTVVSATETANLRNQNMTTEQAMAAAQIIVQRAKTDRIRATVTIAMSFGCAFEGPVDPGWVLELAGKAIAAGADELIFADSAGMGVPGQIRHIVEEGVRLGALIGVHLHNTRNMGFANAWAALEAGALLMDASVGGIGGCPFVPGATGNIATEDLLYLLEGEGVQTGIDADAVVETARWLGSVLDRSLPGALHRIGTSHALRKASDPGDRGRGESTESADMAAAG